MHLVVYKNRHNKHIQPLKLEIMNYQFKPEFTEWMINTLPTIFLSLVVLIAFIFLIRFIGAWLLRINEIIDTQKQIVEELKKLNKK